MARICASRRFSPVAVGNFAYVKFNIFVAIRLNCWKGNSKSGLLFGRFFRLALVMMTGAILKAWKTVKNHVPLIKFRKGGPFRENTPSAAPPPAAGGGKSGAPASSSKAQQLPVIEDWQLPPHYRRAPLDPKEIDAINSGGAY